MKKQRFGPLLFWIITRPSEPFRRPFFLFFLTGQTDFFGGITNFDLRLTGNFFSLRAEEFQIVTAVFDTVQTGFTADGDFAIAIGNACGKQVDIIVGSHAADVAVTLFFIEIDDVFQTALRSSPLNAIPEY